ncbi:predicted protein [Chaetomium globosum CBS 148.51]|uniref:Uncharacterized protein n=1 Tax=Chaetomium globosum (strain ATCC 6205 / CBS 148.51 / DSM 1962 / NBRC 6347 / NRRL 1970) TaxID=306901 RepID=Q2H4N7_CHAGB|nr:uncharacterized protein CHGG_06378 [Chaetomium globosum CBS 148.51]EAQ89759.1 predicted protein [Chaetomium globosum CBS 148.51]
MDRRRALLLDTWLVGPNISISDYIGVPEDIGGPAAEGGVDPGAEQPKHGEGVATGWPRAFIITRVRYSDDNGYGAGGNSSLGTYRPSVASRSLREERRAGGSLGGRRVCVAGCHGTGEARALRPWILRFTGPLGGSIGREFVSKINNGRVRT